MKISDFIEMIRQLAEDTGAKDIEIDGYELDNVAYVIDPKHPDKDGKIVIKLKGGFKIDWPQPSYPFLPYYYPPIDPSIVPDPIYYGPTIICEDTTTFPGDTTICEVEK